MIEESIGCTRFSDTFRFWSWPPRGWAARQRWRPMPIMAANSPGAGAPPVTWLKSRAEAGEQRTRPVRRHRAQVGFHPGKVAFFLLDRIRKMPNFSVEPERSGRSCRLYRLAAAVSVPKVQIPAGGSRQGSAERLTNGEWVTRWPVKELRYN